MIAACVLILLGFPDMSTIFSEHLLKKNNKTPTFIFKKE